MRTRKKGSLRRKKARLQRKKGGEQNNKKDERYCKYISTYGILRSCEGIPNLHYMKTDVGAVNNFQVPSTPFVLVTHHGDPTIPDSCINKSNEILNSPNLVHWFSQNLTKHDNPKLTPIPIGINYHSLYLQEEPNLWWGEGGVETPVEQEKYLETLEKKPFYERELKVYTNFSHRKHNNNKLNKSDRVAALEQIPKDLIVIEESGIKRKKTWENMVKYAFTASPLGKGLDCHRTWEILASGGIPIVKKSTNDPLYKDLPVLIVNAWSDINKNLLKDTINKFKNTKFNMDKITNKYWVDLIKEKCPK